VNLAGRLQGYGGGYTNLNQIPPLWIEGVRDLKWL